LNVFDFKTLVVPIGFLDTNLLNSKMNATSWVAPLRQLFIAFILAAFVLGCDTKGNRIETEQEFEGNISISGAFALYPLTVRWAEEFMKIHPKVHFDISAGGTEKGINDLLTQKVDLAMFSSNLSDEMRDGLYSILVAKDAVLPTVSGANPYLDLIRGKGIDSLSFRKIFVTGEYTSWSEILQVESEHRLNIYTRSDACGAGRVWARYLGVQQDDLLGEKVFGDQGVANALRTDTFGFGYNNLAYVFDFKTRKVAEGLCIVPVDFNGNGKLDEQELFYGSLNNVLEAIKNGIITSPPARELYFISKGKPDRKLVVEFLKFIFSDGQEIVRELGYVEISPDVGEKQMKGLS